MDEHRPTEGGAANTPPFPRLVEGTDQDRSSAAANEPEPPSHDEHASTSESPPEGEASPDTGSRHEPPGTRRARSRRRPRLGAPDFARRARATIRQRTETGLHRGFSRLADRFEETAERLERVADDRLQGDGPRARAGVAAQAAARWIDDVADYLRSSDADRVRDDMERRVRERPLQTLLVATAAGWILGKVMR